MVNLMVKKRGWTKIEVNSAYLQNFSTALLNWERNRKEDQFAFGKFDLGVMRTKSKSRV
jgi:hypothetical protein